VAAGRRADATLEVGGEPTRLVRGWSTTVELFEVLGVAPVLGPGFRPGDDALGAEPIAVVSDSLWRQLGRSRSIVGQRIELAGRLHTVVGVMPRGFWFPDPTIDVWVAEEVDPQEQNGNYALIGRMRPGFTVEAMGPQLERITRLLDERYDFPEQWDLTRDPTLTPVRESLLGSVRPALLALLVAMAVILVIACVNVSALMLGQVDSRGTELAVRAALGAGRARLLQQLVVESLVLGSLAGLAGAALAAAGFRLLVLALPLGALTANASLDWSLFWIAMVVALVAATATAIAPSAAIARCDPQSRLGTMRTAGIAGGRGGRLETGLVVAQIALVLLLAAGAALLVRSVANLRAIDPGIDIDGIAVLDIVMPDTLEQSRRPRVIDEILRAVRGLPGIESAAATQRLPLRGSANNWGILVEGRPDLEATTTAFRLVSPDYFQTMGIEVRSGRGLLDTDRDADAAEAAVVINQAVADQYFPGVDPLGRRIAFRTGRWDRVVGVVGNVSEATLTPEPFPARYMVYEQVGRVGNTHTIVLRTAGRRDPAAILDSARLAIQAAAPGVAVQETTTMRHVFTRAIGPAHQVMSLLTLLGALAMTLGMIGVYGVVSHFVNRRQREWGIHLALGMAPPAVAGRILARGGAILLAGIVVGLAAFLALARLLRSFLYELSPTDLGAIGGATAILIAAGFLATFLPARRASRIDPAAVLREQ
jgi:predicted permease